MVAGRCRRVFVVFEMVENPWTDSMEARAASATVDAMQRLEKLLDRDEEEDDDDMVVLFGMD